MLRTKQYLVAIRPTDGALIMSTMLFGDEIVAQGELDDLPAGSERASARELTWPAADRRADRDFDPGRITTPTASACST